MFEYSNPRFRGVGSGAKGKIKISDFKLFFNSFCNLIMTQIEMIERMFEKGRLEPQVRLRGAFSNPKTPILS
jgi:hypothetical protein